MKQAIIVNQSLRLPKGKLAAQVAHASVGAYLDARDSLQHAWLEEGMPKVVLGAATVEDLLALENQAKDLGVSHSLVEDAGRTVIPAGTITCLGLGPDDDATIDAITGSLKLL